MTAVDLFFGADGAARAIYTDDVDLRGLAAALGTASIDRASHVEPDHAWSDRSSINWWADMSPSGGPLLGPFDRRSDALAAEVAWLQEHLASLGEDGHERSFGGDDAGVLPGAAP